MSATVLPLAGVALGTAGALLGQRMAVRAESLRAATERAAAQRAERKEAIMGFLGAAERIEQMRGTAAGRRHQPDGFDLIELTHALWLAKKLIELVCSAELAQAAQNYTREMDRVTWSLADNEWKDASRALTAREHELRVEFMEIARYELGCRGEPLSGRTRSNPPFKHVPEHDHTAASTNTYR